MSAVLISGVPFTSKGRPDGIARGIGALREQGLVERLGAVADVSDGGDLHLERATSRRAASGLSNEPGLVELVERVGQAVAAAKRRGRRPLLVGGDCPVMLGALAELRQSHGGCGLLMIDGHEDAWPPPQTPAGEASDSELGIALGRFGELSGGLEQVSGVLRPEHVVLLGSRDAREIKRAAVPSLRGELGGFLPGPELAAADPNSVIGDAVGRLAASGRWWLHLDLDVLRSEDFPAADYLQPGGLRWAQLETLAAGAWAAPGCAGASVVIYNADLDPDRSVARRTVEFIATMIAGLER
jgi:arginase